VAFITQLPESQGQTQIMVVVDRLTKMAHFIGLAKNVTAKEVADTLLKEVWKLHRLLSEMVADLDAKLLGQFWEASCKGLGIKGECRQHITHIGTDKPKEATKCWKVTFETSSTMTKTTGISY